MHGGTTEGLAETVALSGHQHSLGAESVTSLLPGSGAPPALSGPDLASLQDSFTQLGAPLLYSLLAACLLAACCTEPAFSLQAALLAALSLTRRPGSRHV